MSVMKKQLKKVRQIADQTFSRTDTKVITKELELTEKRLEALKQACLVLHKKMLICHQGAGQEPLEKRKKRMPEIQLSNCMHECLETHMEGNTLLWQVLESCSALQSTLGEALLEAQLQAEKEVLASMHDFLEVDIPNLSKMRKQLLKLGQDMDSAKSRHDLAMKHFTNQSTPSQSSSQVKVDAFREELEELTMKVEQARDTYAAELYALVSREPSICQNLVQWYELQTAFHERSLQILNDSTPALNKLIEQSNHRPLYGCSLDDHLRCSGREIALVLEACVCCLLETAINEEGLFRIAGSASKVKKIKNALDAGVTDMWEYVTDPHAVAGVLKSYLRALPEPLLTFDAYEEWIQADRIGDCDARLQRLWQVLNSLPKTNYNNLRYLVKFLRCLCKNSDLNKMSSQNLSIVMAPNLLWSPAAQQSNHIGLNMSAANAHSSIVETLISYCDWFFPDEVSFRVTLAPFLLKGLTTPPVAEEGGSSPTMMKGIVNTAFEGVNGETDESGQSPRVVHRPGKKPAPPVPQLSQTDADPQSNPSSKPADFPVGRSATLDRPGKPKRASTRKSHDNLASLLNLDGANPQNSAAQQTKPGKDNNQKSSLGSSQVSLTDNKKENASEPTEQHAPVTDQSKEHSNESVLLVKNEEAVQKPSSTVPQPVPRKERDVKIENMNIQPVVSKSLQRSNGTTENVNPEKILEDGSVKAAEPTIKQLASEDANTCQPDVPTTTAKEATRQIDVPTTKAKEATRQIDMPTTKAKEATRQSSENLSKIVGKQNDPVYENLTKKDQASTEGQSKKADPGRGETDDHPPPSRTTDGHDKPQVPSKPIALLTDSKLAQDSSVQIRSLEKRPLDGSTASLDERGRRGGSGDRWQFLTSGSGPEKVPDRPPKVPPPEEVERPPPSPKVKPPRPQPPAPPLKPRINSEAEDTRL